MAKSQAEPPVDGDGEGQQDQALSERVGALEAGQDSLTGKVDQILGILSKGGDGGGHGSEPTEPEPRGGTPGGIAHEIREQLDKAEAERAARDKEAGRESELAQLKEQVRSLAEAEPVPPPTRKARIMGWT